MPKAMTVPKVMTRRMLTIGNSDTRVTRDRERGPGNRMRPVSLMNRRADAVRTGPIQDTDTATGRGLDHERAGDGER
ncbi:hypothetical protein GCM10008965_38580 [Methylorubrum aminovorans]